MSTITGADTQKMVGHWLETPVNGYLGSGYGQDIKSLLQHPQSDGSADEYLAKLKEDVPILQVMPTGSVNLYGVSSYPDKLDLFIEVSGSAIAITG